jgi:transcriptional regulator with XRE-family HTH domain
MLQSFGARLRQRREDQGIALSTVAEQTKIKRSLLEELERDNVSHWPAGFFGRAFIRAYAQAIGLNADVVVREFLEAHPEPVEAVAAAAGTAAASDSGVRSILGSAFGSLGRLRGPVAAERAVAVPPLEPIRVAPARETSPSADVDFVAVAELCTDFGRVETASDLQARLQDVARILDVNNLILWVWDVAGAELKPALAHGYSDEVLARLPTVARDADNATAAAFRTGATCEIDRTDRNKGALAVPLVTPAGCVGVLALELEHGGDRIKSIRAAATIFAAVLALLIGGS